MYEERIPAVIISQSSNTKKVNVILKGYFLNFKNCINGRIFKEAIFCNFFISW